MTVKQKLPNFITCLRIVGTAVLMLTEPLSKCFFAVYLFTGLTDVLDGLIARMTKTTSELGARLDSVADLLFYAVMLFRVFPILQEKFPIGVWIAIAVVIAVRLVAYAVAWIRYRRFASMHTYLNKLTGAAVFLYPFILISSAAVPCALVVCSIAGVASVEELLIHLLSHHYDSGIKSIFQFRI